jgi:hypothetical protein
MPRSASAQPFFAVTTRSWREESLLGVSDPISGTRAFMPMRATTVRFSEDLWNLLEAESSDQGISAAQFVRDATIMRLGMLSGARGDGAASLTLQHLAADALGRRHGGVRRPAPQRIASVVHDKSRLKALHALNVLDTDAEESYDRITRLARKLLGVPIAVIALIDDDRQFLKSAFGLPEPWASERETPLSHSICQYTIAASEPLLIADARQDVRYRDSLAVPDLDLVAYAGAPLVTADGYAVGSLCAIDHRPRTWRTDHVETLEALAASVVNLMELHMAGGPRTTLPTAA